MMKERKKFQPIVSRDVLEAYNTLVSKNQVSFDIPQDAEDRLNSLIENVLGTTFGVEHYQTFEEKIFAYFYFIVKNHIFYDGNKRTASLVFLTLCELNEKKIEDDISVDELAIFLEQFSGNDHQKFIRNCAKLFLK